MQRPVFIGYILLVAMVTNVHGNKALDVCGDETGYNCQFQSNEMEVSDIQVYFDNELPSWLTGTLIRNGVGQFERGDQSVSHVFDGFAKLSSWKFLPDGTAFFSTRFVRSGYYKDTMKQTKLAPYMLFAPPVPAFNVFQKAQCFVKGVDNLNVNIYDFPTSSGGKTFAVFGDYWRTYQISPTDLSTLKYIKPKLEKGNMVYLDMMSSGHPLPEPGTNNRLTFLVRQKTSRFLKNSLVLVRMSSISKRSTIAQWKTKDSIPYMHSFSVTQTKAVMLAGPYFCDTKCLFKKAAPLPCMDWEGGQSSKLYIADLKSGKKITITMPAMFVLHHINAYDVDSNEMIVDVSSYDSPNIVNDMLLMDVVKNHEKRTAKYVPARNKRLRINIKTKKVTITDMSTNDPVVDGIDMPAINEDYRSREYCFVYGFANFADGLTYTSFRLVKKDMCNGGSVVAELPIPSHYPVELVFVPNPDGTTEDDGVLLAPILRGEDAVTYLAVLDAKTMTMTSKADMPDYIPLSLHGRFFKDQY